MKYPKHLILDLSPNTAVTSTWQAKFKEQLISTKSHSPAHSLSLPHVNNTGSHKTAELQYSRSLTLPIFDIHFLRKEKLYTKLKYSRCPQYDIVSGGFAAILAGFIGFLISEKFGIELVDSGDFYTAFMYLVFATFSLRPLIRSYSEGNTPYTPFSLKYPLIFFHDVLTLILSTAVFYLSALARALRKYNS